MENIADYIPLLLVLGSVILSAITGSKKKKNENKRAPLPSPHTNPFPYEPEPEPIYIPEYIEPEVPVQPIVQPVIPKKKKEASLKNRFAPSAETKTAQVDESTEPFLNIQDLDEVKKAVIYSEIFNRKDY